MIAIGNSTNPHYNNVHSRVMECQRMYKKRGVLFRYKTLPQNPTLIGAKASPK